MSLMVAEQCPSAGSERAVSISIIPCGNTQVLGVLLVRSVWSLAADTEERCFLVVYCGLFQPCMVCDFPWPANVGS